MVFVKFLFGCRDRYNLSDASKVASAHVFKGFAMVLRVVAVIMLVVVVSCCACETPDHRDYGVHLLGHESILRHLSNVSVCDVSVNHLGAVMMHDWLLSQVEHWICGVGDSLLFAGPCRQYYPHQVSAYHSIGILVLVIRPVYACGVTEHSWLANLRRKRKISPKMQFVMWFAGLRGAIAFALAMNMPNNERGDWDNDVVITTTLLSALVHCC